ncbi:hypothetical protein PUNSTDRAFT_120840 [Punctularia strigosozonata HHB-11173 SS5]|uniref:uncharacterized protein n=1 Tax=Punctularia strigosozonata (strain HHB-11173) TaxID=741275 RepID=UPI0004417B8F|nr:uncharacterized protein PUNSTDRAFT_120840 [Punctularia strigosozonata HHB-11173 SS5]EIN08520.1 hypothetical protein PUNSTDRAFT_120840 [Punctularia strigosozonata HHB-11173 SS5]
MFRSVVQPNVVSIFSSSGSNPLVLFGVHVDKDLPTDSFVHLLKDETSSPEPDPPKALLDTSASTGKAAESSQLIASVNYKLDQTVLHMQSPTLNKTYIQSPKIHTGRASDLYLKHPWMHLQVRHLERDWAFEVGVVDQMGREGVLRCSTFQNEPHLHLSNPPILSLPLTLPSPSSRPLTNWVTIDLNLPRLLPHFSSLARRQSQLDLEDAEEDEILNKVSSTGATRSSASIPVGSYSHVAYVRVYATCRLRRIWFSETNTGKTPWELELYGAD